MQRCNPWVTGAELLGMSWSGRAGVNSERGGSGGRAPRP